MYNEVKRTAVVLILMFVCIFPMFACLYGQQYGPVNYADDKRNYEWTYGIEVIIIPLVFFTVFSVLILLFVHYSNKSQAGKHG